MLYILHHIAVLCRLAMQCPEIFCIVISCSILLHCMLSIVLYSHSITHTLPLTSPPTDPPTNPPTSHTHTSNVTYTLTPTPTTTTQARKYLRLGVNFIKACAVRSVPEADLPIRCVFA